MEAIKNEYYTRIAKRYSIELCRTNPKFLFVFGDNLERTGMGGQAIIREQVNSIGLATKKNPGSQYFTDDEYKKNCEIIDEEIQKIKDYMEEKQYTSIIFPQMGLGTGLSDLPRKAPKTFCYLTLALIDEWQFNNLEFLMSKPM